MTEAPRQDAQHQQRWHTTDERIGQVEEQVDSLVQALHALIDGLERSPTQDPKDDRAGHGARLAREILLTRGL
jgi:hypothetical protein